MYKGLLLSLALVMGGANASVVVTFQPIHDLVSKVASGGMKVERLAPVGASPHHFDPTPRDVARIRKAKVAFSAGLGADAWMERYAKSSASKAKLVPIGEKINFVKLKSGDSTDPHWWLDASLMAQATDVVASELSAADPANAATYRRNAATEKARLNALHSELQRSLAPLRGRKMVTFHNAFGYFARAYGLQVVGTLTPPAGTEVTPAQMRTATEIVRKHNLRAIFAEPQLPDRAAQAVAKETGAKVFLLDPEGSRGREDYAAMLRHNRDTLLKALQ